MSARPPRAVSDWTKLFESSALYRHSYGQMFEDWVEICICCFANQTMEARYLEIVKRYTRDELDVMAKLMAMLIMIHEEQTKGGGWFDALGEIYEYLTSRQKSSRMGQFFTPHALCEVMARITLHDQDDVTVSPSNRNTITGTDPACGSGRLLLAMHAQKPLGLVLGADIDPVCAKMCALNFWLHGIKGEVACMDSLRLRWSFAYQTHPRPLWPFITYLGEERQESSIMWQQCQRDLVPAAPVVTSSAVEMRVDLFNQPA